MVRGVLALVMVACCPLLGCGEAPAPAAAAPAPTSPLATIDANLIEDIAQATYRTSPPDHPTLAWADLAPRIEAARAQLSLLPPLARPETPADPLAGRIGSAQVRALGEARRRAMVIRAESARLLARADPDGAAAEIAGLLELARSVAAWGVPAAAETSAELIAGALDAMERPEAAPMTEALSRAGRAQLRAALASLDQNDPAGRLRAITETSAARIEALQSRAGGPDGPTVVRGVAGRYVPGAALGTPQDIDRATREAFAFSRALADGWEKSSRPAITVRLRQRQAEDSTGVLTVLLGDAADVCDDDARLRERIAAALEALR